MDTPENTLNLYWPVYKNLESEVLTLSKYIHFSDDQSEVYSMYIADLIVRCAIEIESISKELYKANGGNMKTVNGKKKKTLSFDTDCLDYLNSLWQIGKKEITVSSPVFYFQDPKFRVMTPLYKANIYGKKGNEWKQAYQALKHDRRNSLKQASIENLLQAMGALYILNLYYKDERYPIGRVYMGTQEFDNRAGSEIFSAACYHATVLSMAEHMDDTNIDEDIAKNLDAAIFIEKYDDSSFRMMHQNFCKDLEIVQRNFDNSKEIRDFLKENPEYTVESINKTCLDAGGIQLLQNIIQMPNTINEKGATTEAVLNKHTNIYPEVFPFK